jgi:selT/selW/selH-like putative selenoprotein
LGVKAELIKGDRGVFDVAVDGRTIFSKYSSHRFPDDDEIIRALKPPRRKSSS